MQMDFHYYATYCAAFLAGWSHGESLQIAYSAQFVDCCSESLLTKIRAPRAAATTQLQLELMDARTDVIGLQNITRIWSSFHFLPRSLDVPVKGRRLYREKYRLICGPNGALTEDTVRLAENGSLQAIGVAMHVLADTWAHAGFAGTPSLVINNTNYWFYELLPEGEGFTERQISFRHSTSTPDDPEKGLYSASIYQMNENSIMNLGHGRAGHLPDYSFMRYRYLPAWGGYRDILKDNPGEYMQAFRQMVAALKCLRSGTEHFQRGSFDRETVLPWEEEIRTILEKRQLDACVDWKAFGERLSGEEIEDFDVEKYQAEYVAATEAEKSGTFLGRFILAALAQKSMVTNKIFRSGNLLAGFSVDYGEKGLKGMRDYFRLAEYILRGEKQ
ncbi:MAG: hypothetical protein K6C12_09835 [Oscillospiraceae bacterium]|nr:hypothetical protein [Oscillospiraceae bacterium]